MIDWRAHADAAFTDIAVARTHEYLAGTLGHLRDAQGNLELAIAQLESIVEPEMHRLDDDEPAEGEE